MNRANQSLDCSDRQVIDYLYGKCAKVSLAKAYSVVQRQSIAQEIVQDVFVKLWKSGIVFPSEKAVYAWVYKACHRAGIDHLRSAKTRLEHGTDELGIYADEKLSLGDRLVSREVILNAVKGLSQEEGELLVYSVVDQMSQSEIAELTETPLRTIQRRLAAITKKLEKVRNDD